MNGNLHPGERHFSFVETFNFEQFIAYLAYLKSQYIYYYLRLDK